MLVAINANDKLMFNMQYNVIPLAAAKHMGVIAMKVFADGAMYTKPAEWSEKPEHVVRTVGSESLPSQSLIKYSLTTPGVHLAIIGTGHISNKDEECQLTNNLAAAQILPDGLSESERAEIEDMAKKTKEGKTNYFQVAALPLTAPKEVTVAQSKENELRNVTVSWSTAYAGDAPMTAYEIWRDGTRVNKITFTPQITTDPFKWSEPLNDKIPHTYILKVVDAQGRIAESMPVVLDKMG
jgi:predicted aldo/keto reductase-like oxidoreductase